MSTASATAPELALVIDIGKSHARLLMVAADGTVVEHHQTRNAGRTSAMGYPALDLPGLEAWIAQTLCSSANTARCQRAIATTHGAAVVALSDDGLAWEPLDYEFEPFDPGDAAEHPQAAAWAAHYLALRDPFEDTFAPDLPAGLNAARQLFWLQRTHPQAWAATRVLLPYPQYWAWRLSGHAASECSSLGCHTQLWRPALNTYTVLASRAGWQRLFAPMHRAWDVLGTVRRDVALHWGLPASCVVHVGVHDSNACLARYLGPSDAQRSSPSALTVVSSGTWTVLMAPGAPLGALRAELDMLCNVDVLGRPTPTARFMGGREFAALCGDADPAQGSLADLQAVIERDVRALPPAASGEPPVLAGNMALRTAGERAALAALYNAQRTAWLVERLWQDRVPPSHRVCVDGPLANNPLYLSVLQALLASSSCEASTDKLEGTARGAWLLSRWDDPHARPAGKAIQPIALPGLTAYHRRWCASLVPR